ncbi:MAG: MFS transporter, partial [Chloroflexota bacterium]
MSANVFFLGLVSFLTDVSSEMVFTLLPLFLLNVLGAGPALIGLIEGVGEATSTSLRLASGWLSDRLGKRKGLTAVGYSLSTVAKPFLYLAHSWGMVLGVRFADRLGKAIRTAPRDALLADSSLPGERGRSFGLHRALDSYGAVVGLGIAALVVFMSQRGAVALAEGTFRTLVLIAIVPAVLAVVVLLSLVSEAAPRTPVPTAPEAAPIPRRFHIFLGVMVVFTLGRLSDAFLVLRAQNLGLSTFNILLLFILFNLVYANLSVVAGRLSDRVGRRVVLVLGWASFALIYLGLAGAQRPWQVMALLVLYGVCYGSTEGVGRAMVADMVGRQRRGTGYGFYHGVVGFAAQI